MAKEKKLAEPQEPKKQGQIELIVKAFQTMTPEEVETYIKSEFETDFDIFKRLIDEQKARMDKVSKDPPMQILLPKVRQFYNDLIADGVIKKNINMFATENLKAFKASQTRKEAGELMEEVKDEPPENYKKVFPKMNDIYVKFYENFIGTYLVSLSVKLYPKSPVTKGAALKNFQQKYKDGKYSELFSCFNSQIRNSIQHEDCLIHVREPKITFYDKDKKPLTLDFMQYKTMVWGEFMLSIAFDIVTFELSYPFYQYLISQIDIVQEYVKKKGLKVKRSGNAPLSLLDWAILIQSGKV